MLAVEDSGCEMAVEDLPWDFEPFFRSPPDSDGRDAGFRLGLAFVRGIAPAIGGTVDVLSEPGPGSRFEVRFLLTEPPTARPSVSGHATPVAAEVDH
jgi:signal transduction histidine kinase